MTLQYLKPALFILKPYSCNSTPTQRKTRKRETHRHMDTDQTNETRHQGRPGECTQIYKDLALSGVTLCMCVHVFACVCVCGGALVRLG